MSENLQETYESLDKVEYHQLKDKFEELGIGEIWKPGTKKKELIQNALEKLRLIQSLKDSGLEGEDLQKAVQEKEQVIKQKQLDEKSKEESLAKQQQAQVEKSFAKKNLSKEDLQKNLAAIDKDLKNPLPTHRIILLKKKELIEKQLAQLESENKD